MLYAGPASKRGTGARMLRKGDSAPEFSGELAGGATLRSKDYRGKRNLIVYFFPKDFTPG